MVEQLYLCPKYKEGEEPNVRVMSVELFVALYNNGELPDPKHLIVTCSEEDMSKALYYEEGVPLDAEPMNGERL
jgi:hypothetical protein|tara:strand:+ start:697 stop:918 length:222 start_codon:yes stop_codon:yes gene_type:complete